MNFQSIINGKAEKLIISSSEIKGGIKKGPFRGVEFYSKYPNISEERNCIWIAGGSRKGNEVRAKFKLPFTPRNDGDCLDSFILRIRGMYDFFKHLPWDKSHVQLNQTLYLKGRFKISINNQFVFNDYVYFNGCRYWRFWPSIEFDVPSKILRKGLNTIVIENLTRPFKKKYDLVPNNTITAETANNTRFVISDIHIIKNSVEDFSVTYCPEYVQVGERFYMEIYALQDHDINVLFPRSISLLSANTNILKKGRPKIYFKALTPDSNVVISIESKNKRKKSQTCIKSVVKTPAGFIPKIGHAVGNVQARNIIKQIEKIRDYHQGNFVGIVCHLIREDPHLSKEFLKWIKYCKDNDLYFSLSPDKFIYPRASEAYKMAPKNFFSMEQWERGSMVTPLQEKSAGNLKEMARAFVKAVKAGPSKVNKNNIHVKMWTMDPSLLLRYYMQAGEDFPGIEGMILHQTLNIACARGTTKAYEAPFWGVVNSFDCQAYGGLYFYEQWRDRLPQIDKIRERLWWISQYMYYLSGARVIESQSGILHSNVNWHCDFEDEYQQVLINVQKNFYQFSKIHKLLAQPEVKIAFVQGKYDMFSGGSYDTENWCGEAEHSWRNISVAIPRVSFRNDEWNWGKLAGTFSDTPYGEVDILPIEAPVEVMNQYSCLIFLGWNSMLKEDYQKLINYVRKGGKIFMCLCHLSSSFKRDAPLKIINRGDLRELFGIKVIKSKKDSVWPVDIYKDILIEAEFCRYSDDERVKFPLEKKFPIAGKTGFTKIQVPGGIHLLGNIRVTEEEEIIMHDRYSKEPVLIEHKLGKGYSYLLNICRYPHKQYMRRLIQSILKGLLDSVERDIQLKEGKNVNYYVYNKGKGNGKFKEIFVIRNDWNEARGPEKCLFLIFGTEIPIQVRQQQVSLIYASKESVFIPDNDRIVIDQIFCKQRNVSIAMQGSGDIGLRCFAVDGKIKGIYDMDFESPKKIRINSSNEIRIKLKGVKRIKLVLQ